jgi:hypothetical protein
MPEKFLTRLASRGNSNLVPLSFNDLPQPIRSSGVVNNCEHTPSSFTVQ